MAHAALDDLGRSVVECSSIEASEDPDRDWRTAWRLSFENHRSDIRREREHGRGSTKYLFRGDELLATQIPAEQVDEVARECATREVERCVNEWEWTYRDIRSQRRGEAI